MNVQISIGDETRSYGSASKEWINHTFALAHKRGVTPCVTVQINEPGLVLGLSTPGCGGGGGGGVPTPAQNRILEAWIKHHLTTAHFTGGDLISFLNDLERLLR